MISFLPILSDIGAPVMPAGPELAPFAPELVLVATIVGVLLTPFFTKRSNAAAALVALAGLTIALFSLIWSKDAGLGERCRDLLRLKLEGKTFPEIQKIMGAAAINTIYTWDHRCRKNLLDAMGGDWERPKR